MDIITLALNMYAQGVDPEEAARKTQTGIPEAWTIAQAAQVKMIHPIATAEIPHGMTAAMKMVLEMGAAPEDRR